MLTDLPETVGLQGQVTHCIISIFEGVLEHICKLSAGQAVQKLLNGRATNKKRARLLAETADFLVAPTEAAEPPSVHEKDKVITKLCQLAIAMMDGLDTRSSTGKDLFDGFLFFVFTRVGDSLGAFVLGREEPASGGGHFEDSIDVHEAQAPYLVYLLKYSTEISAKKCWDQAPRCAGKDLPRSHGSDAESDKLSTEARLRLQHTLLKGVFPKQATKFMEALRKPADTKTDPDLMIGAEVKDLSAKGISKWFSSKVWETIGWEAMLPVIQWT